MFNKLKYLRQQDHIIISQNVNYCEARGPQKG